MVTYFGKDQFLILQLNFPEFSPNMNTNWNGVHKICNNTSL